MGVPGRKSREFSESGLEIGLEIGWEEADCCEISSLAWALLGQGSLDAVVDAIAYIDIKPPRLTKQGFVAGGAAAVAVAGRFLLGIRFRFHNYAPQQLASELALHQQAANELGGNLLGGAGEEGLG